MITDDHQFRDASRCELLPYVISLPLGLSRKQAKDLLRFRRWPQKPKPPFPNKTGWGPNTNYQCGNETNSPPIPLTPRFLNFLT